MSDVSSASSSASSSANSANLAAGQANLNTSYSTFLTLLTTQLKNQDPTSPLDTNAFTQQLVAMTGVQQQLLSNNLLQEMVNNSSSQSATNLIGKNVSASTNVSTLSGGTTSWHYNLPSDAASGTATISDSTGAVVWTGPLSGLKSGDNTFSWNGKNASGAQLADGGSYSLAISASDSNGQADTPAISISGVAKSVQTIGGVTSVTIGATQVPVTEVVSVSAS
jgi:flagellar basal-body rod modification protein FlgD